jgi:hypothetical protein
MAPQGFRSFLGASPVQGLVGSVLSQLVGFSLTSDSVTAKPLILLDLAGRQQSCLLDVRIQVYLTHLALQPSNASQSLSQAFRIHRA